MIKSIAKLIISNILPALIGLIAIPSIIHNIGIGKFGMVSIFWMIAGTLNFLDFGIPKAITYHVSKKGISDTNDIDIISSLINMLLYLGCAFLIITIVSGLFYYYFMGGNSENILSVLIVVMTVPVIIFSNSYRGILEGLEKFDRIAIIRFFVGTWMFLAPLVVSCFSSSLIIIALSLLIGRVVFLFAFLLFTSPYYKLKPVAIELGKIKPLLKYAIGTSISGIISPLLSYADRFVIGYYCGSYSLGQYASSNEINQRSLILASTLTSVIFPKMAFLIENGKWSKLEKLVLTSSLCVFFIYGVWAVVAKFFGNEIISLWLKIDDVEIISQLLFIGSLAVAINSLGYTYFSLIHALGKSSYTAKVHIIEAIVYIPLLSYMTINDGLFGAAYTYLAKNTFDTLIMLISGLRFISYEQKNNRI